MKLSEPFGRAIYVLISSFSHCYRHRYGLVGPRALVARTESLADQNPQHPGPVWRGGGRAAAFHADAQDPEGATAGHAVPRLPRRLFRQDVQRGHQFVQGTR